MRCLLQSVPFEQQQNHTRSCISVYTYKQQLRVQYDRRHGSQLLRSFTFVQLLAILYLATIALQVRVSYG